MVPNNGITARYLLLEEGRQLIASQQFLGPLALLKAAGCVVETGQHDGATQVLQDEEEENLLFFDLFWGGNMGNYTPKPTRPPEIQKKNADSSPNKGGRTKLWYLARKPPMFHPPFFGGWDVVGLVGHATKCQRKIAISPSQIEMGIWWDVPKNNYWGANHQEVKRLYRLFIILQRCGLKPPSRGIPKIIQHLGVG